MINDGRTATWSTGCEKLDHVFKTKISRTHSRLVISLKLEIYVDKEEILPYIRTSVLSLLQIVEIVYLDHGIIFIKLMAQTQNKVWVVKLADIYIFWVRNWGGVVRLWESYAKNKDWNSPLFLLWQNFELLSIPKVP